MEVVWGSVHLEGVARQRERAAREQRAGGDAELPLDEVDARHHLRHRVLDLHGSMWGVRYGGTMPSVTGCSTCSRVFISMK